MRRSFFSGIVIAATMTLCMSATSASIARSTSVISTSKGWVVTLSVTRTSLKSDSTMPARLTIDNRTGHSVNVNGCAEDFTFTMVLSNKEVPNKGVSGLVACSTTLHPGANVFHEKIASEYDVCNRTGLPSCSKPGLPVGLYRTSVNFDGSPSSVPRPGTLWINVTK